MRRFARSPPLAARLLGQRDMDINGTMCGGIGGRNSKDDFASDYDSDETVIDDSSLGSYDENDQLQLKSLFFNKDDTRTPVKLCHFGNEMLVHLSPEIQHLSKLEHNNQAQTRDVSMEEHTCFQSAEVSANSKSSLIKYKSQELEDDNSVTFSKNTSGQSESPFSGSESEGDNNSNPSPIQSKRRKSKDSQCIRLTSKRSSSSEKEISSGITKRFKKSLNLLHSEPSWHSETPSREPAESSATKTGLIADYKCKFQRRKVFEKNHYGETSLHRAAKQSDVDLLYRLIKIGAEVNRADNAGWTALHEACVYGNYNAAKCLLEAGADVNATGFGQVAPIHDAVCQGDYEMAKLLLEHGANPHLVTEIGKSAFDYIEDVNIRNLLLLFDSKKSAPALHMDVTSRQPTIIATTPREDRGADGNGAAVDIGNACNKYYKIEALLQIMVKCNLVKWSKESIDTGQSYKMYNNPDLPSHISTESNNIKICKGPKTTVKPQEIVTLTTVKTHGAPSGVCDTLALSLCTGRAMSVCIKPLVKSYTSLTSQFLDSTSSNIPIMQDNASSISQVLSIDSHEPPSGSSYEFASSTVKGFPQSPVSGSDSVSLNLHNDFCIISGRDDSIVPQDICLDALLRPYKHYSIHPCKVSSHLLRTDVSKIPLRGSTTHFKSTDSDRPQKSNSINLHRAYSIRPYRDSCDMLLHTFLSKLPKCPSSHVTRGPSNILALRLPNTPQKQTSTTLPNSSSRIPLRMHSKIQAKSPSRSPLKRSFNILPMNFQFEYSFKILPKNYSSTAWTFLAHEFNHQYSQDVHDV